MSFRKIVWKILRGPQLPHCYGYSYMTPDGEEHDCDACLPDDCDGCEDCLTAYRSFGGTINPDNGRRYPKWLCRILYGPPCTIPPLTAKEAEHARLEAFFQKCLDNYDRKHPKEPTIFDQFVEKEIKK
jgi:hypothetical protein